MNMNHTSWEKNKHHTNAIIFAKALQPLTFYL